MKIIWNKVTWYSKLLAVFVFAVAIWLGVYFTNQYKEIQGLGLVSHIDINTVDTLNWKTYKNEKYGFEFKYNKDLVLSEQSFNKDFALRLISGKGGYGVIVTVSPIEDFIPASGQEPSYYDKQSNELITYSSISKDREISRVGPSKSGDGWEGFYFYSTLVIPNVNAGYIISIDESATPEETKYLDNSPVTNSFKFINQISAVDTSNWKTYRNEKYGFEIAHPQKLTVKPVGMSGINWQINTGTSEVYVGLTEKGQVNCNYDNASEKIKGVYAFLKYSGNPTRYVIMTNKDYDFEVVEACGVNRCSDEEYNLQDQIVETFMVTGDTKSLNCAG